MNHFLERIKKSGTTKAIVLEIRDEHKLTATRMRRLYERYKASVEGVPILTRRTIEYEDFETGSVKRLDNKVNNMLNNAFDADIIDTKVGYFLGHPITYEYDDKRKPGTSSPVKDEIDTFNTRNHVEDEDAELGKMASICGYGARLAYIDKDGNERIKNINPWEVVFLGDNIHEPERSMRYYEDSNGQLQVEFYDDTYIYMFGARGTNNFGFIEKIPHMFDFNPLYGLANNKELQGDAEKVLNLIDAYDRTLSDASNEIEQWRLAYLVLKGVGVDEDTMENLNKTGIFEMMDKDDDLSYLTKEINDNLIEHHLDRLEKNIMKFAKSVDFSDEAFSGTVTGVALKHKLRGLENKCITMERKFTAMLRYQYKVIFSARQKRVSMGKDDYLKVWFGFKRNNPIHLLEEAQALALLKGQVSDRTRLAASSLVDDVDYEIAEMENDALRLGERLEPLEDDPDEPVTD